MKRILVASPVRQEPAILREFLRSLRELERGDLALDFALVDDNDAPPSSELLGAFRPGGTVRLLAGEAGGAPYVKTEQTHFWRSDLIRKVARYKDRFIDLARQEGYDGLFLVDSDLVLHPLTLQQLVGAHVDVIAEIFWTQWMPGQPELPQVWLRDEYALHHQERGERLTPEQQAERTRAFLERLRRPGIYEVGGLGACTLISRRALDLGVSFAEIPNLSFWGEDRHFCIRAAALGLRLYVDTHYPALHLYREDDLKRVSPYREQFPAMTAAAAAVQAAREALERRGTTHYLTMTGREGLSLLAEPLRSEAAAGAEAVVAEDRRTEAVSRFKLLWARPVARGAAQVQVEGAALQQGRIAGRPFANHLGVQATLEAAGEQWLVSDIDLTPLRTPYPPIPLVRKGRQNRVVLSMLVRNEADRYLRQVLSHAASYVDAVLILDDASTDQSAALCHDLLHGREHQIVTLPASGFHREHELRQKQWELALTMEPDWILCLDADELFEERIRRDLRDLVNQGRFDAVAFRLYDFWDEAHYREDRWWRAHQFYRPFLVRPLPELEASWPARDQHCGRFPTAVARLPALQSPVRLKHLGWSRPEDRQRKYQRYMQLDPDGRFGIREQYHSILDPNPHLVRWIEAEPEVES
ncbi:MAG: glycosyltransferase [Bacillota bacterium]